MFRAPSAHRSPSFFIESDIDFSRELGSRAARHLLSEASADKKRQVLDSINRMDDLVLTLTVKKICFEDCQKSLALLENIQQQVADLLHTSKEDAKRKILLFTENRAKDNCYRPMLADPQYEIASQQWDSFCELSLQYYKLQEKVNFITENVLKKNTNNSVSLENQNEEPCCRCTIL